MNKTISLIIAFLCYHIGLSGLFFLILWIGDLLPIVSINSGIAVDINVSIIKNLSLILLFGVQHSIMARENFKKKFKKVIPPQLERSLYVAVSGLLCWLIVWQWEPVPGNLWSISSQSPWYYILYGIYFLGIICLVFSTFLINHLELLGIKQVNDHAQEENTIHPQFKETSLYKIVRHPIYLGILIILWAIPHMSFSHFILASGFTFYIYIGAYFEEKDLIKEFGTVYNKYRQRVPKVIPFIKFNISSKIKTKYKHLKN